MIRPIDLQATILQSMQNTPAVQRAEDGSRLAAQAAQAAFAAEVTERDETVAPTTEVLGNRVDAKDERQAGDGRSGQRKHDPHSSFEEIAASVADDADEPPHLIDVTA